MFIKDCMESFVNRNRPFKSHWTLQLSCMVKEELYQRATEEFSSQSGPFPHSGMNNRIDLQIVAAKNNAPPQKKKKN